MRPSAASRPARNARAEAFGDAFAREVAAGLSATPRAISPRWLYDGVGSVLFDAICRLPWYPITRAETSLLDRHAGDIAAQLPHVAEVIELGPGSGAKLRWHVRVMALHQSAEPLDPSPRYVVGIPTDEVCLVLVRAALLLVELR